jgi:hypothetical protein
VVRPHTPDLVRKSAEILAKSGAFPLVVVSGLEADQATMLRLSRMVHEGGGALVVLTSNGISASLRLTSRYLPNLFRMSAGPFGPAAIESVAIQVGARTPGWQATTIIHCSVTPYDFRLALDPTLADRRGALD